MQILYRSSTTLNVTAQFIEEFIQTARSLGIILTLNRDDATTDLAQLRRWYYQLRVVKVAIKFSAMTALTSNRGWTR